MIRLFMPEIECHFWFVVVLSKVVVSTDACVLACQDFLVNCISCLLFTYLHTYCMLGPATPPSTRVWSTKVSRRCHINPWEVHGHDPKPCGV